MNVCKLYLLSCFSYLKLFTFVLFYADVVLFLGYLTFVLLMLHAWLYHVMAVLHKLFVFHLASLRHISILYRNHFIGIRGKVFLKDAQRSSYQIECPNINCIVNLAFQEQENM